MFKSTIACLGLCLTTYALASSTPKATEQKVPASSVKIMPHRAYYTVKLKSATHDSQVKNTEGRMIIELSHDAAGWMLKQESASVVHLKEGPSETMRSVYTAWESNDGKILKFNTERVFNEQSKDHVEGSAEFNDQGGLISYRFPEAKQIKMAPGTLPPMLHLRKLIQGATSNVRSSSVQVFDGSFYGNPVLIDTFIGDKKGTCNITNTNEAVYSMSLAVYAMPSNSSNPNFEIIQHMGANGILCSYEINFGDYIVIGTLDRFEPLPDKT